MCDVDWDDGQTDLAHLGGAAPGAAKSGGDKLWEDNWDDDDVEDDFSAQLRCVSIYSNDILFAYACSLLEMSWLRRMLAAKQCSTSIICSGQAITRTHPQTCSPFRSLCLCIKCIIEIPVG